MTTTNAPTIEHEIGHEGRLEIRLPSAELHLRASQDGTVRVTTRDGRPLPTGIEVREEPGALTIRQPGRERFGLSIGGGTRSADLDVEVPAAALVAIEIAGGSIEASGLTGSQAYRSVSGDIRLERVAGTIAATVVSGELAVGVEGRAGLAIRSVSGDVEVTGGTYDDLKVSTTSGDVEIEGRLHRGGAHAIETLSGDVDLRVGGDLTINARTVSGDLRSDLPHRSDGRMGRRVVVIGDGGTELDFRSVSGDLRVRDAHERGSAAADPTPAGPPARPAVALPALPDLPELSDADESDSSLDDDRLTILRALESGEIDVAEATRRLADLEGGNA